MQQLIGNKIKISKLLEDNSSGTFINCDVFEETDKIILERIINLLNDGVGEYSNYLNLIDSRKTTHFYKKYEREYKAVKWAINLLNKKRKLDSNIKTESSYDMFKTYVKEYYYYNYYSRSWIFI